MYYWYVPEAIKHLLLKTVSPAQQKLQKGMGA